MSTPRKPWLLINSANTFKGCTRLDLKTYARTATVPTSSNKTRIICAGLEFYSCEFLLFYQSRTFNKAQTFIWSECDYTITQPWPKWHQEWNAWSTVIQAVPQQSLALQAVQAPQPANLFKLLYSKCRCVSERAFQWDTRNLHSLQNPPQPVRPLPQLIAATKLQIFHPGSNQDSLRSSKLRSTLSLMPNE